MPDLRKRSIRPFRPDSGELSKVEWPLERTAFRLLWLLLLACPFWLAIDRRERGTSTPAKKARFDRYRARWVVGWLLLLAVIWIWNPDQSVLRVIFAGLAGIRLFEIFTTGLGTVLEQAEQVGARNLVTIGIYAMQLILIFAILYHSFATASFVTEVNGCLIHASRPSDYLYISWSALTTVGNSVYVPKDSMARFLSVMTTTAGVLLLGILLAYGINSVKGHASSNG